MGGQFSRTDLWRQAPGCSSIDALAPCRAPEAQADPITRVMVLSRRPEIHCATVPTILQLRTQRPQRAYGSSHTWQMA
eukprot:9483302-Pyramimonas_sp.AAC.1